MRLPCGKINFEAFFVLIFRTKKVFKYKSKVFFCSVDYNNVKSGDGVLLFFREKALK